MSLPATAADPRTRLRQGGQADLGWTAGLLEGEGYFGLFRGRSPYVAVRMTDRDVLERLLSLYGGSLYGPDERPGRTPCWSWELRNHRHAAGLMMTIWPYMGARRRARIEEVLLAWREVQHRGYAWRSGLTGYGS